MPKPNEQYKNPDEQLKAKRDAIASAKEASKAIRERKRAERAEAREIRLAELNAKKKPNKTRLKPKQDKIVERIIERVVEPPARIILEGISLETLTGLIKTIVKESLEELRENPIIVSDTYITRKQACVKLGVTLPTLYTWDIEGILVANRVGSRVRYKLSDVMDLLQGKIKK